MLRQMFYGLALSAALPVAALHAQAFNFTTSGGFVGNPTRVPPAVIDHGTVTGPLNPFGVTRQVSLQFISPTANPTVLSVSGTFTWFTADPLNTILGNYSGLVQLGAAGAFSFANTLVTIIDGTGIFADLRGSALASGSGQFFGDPTLPVDVSGTSTITWIGTATTVPEPGSSALLLAGLGAVAVFARRRAGARFGTIERGRAG
ncbi:MAG: PEP-CTERM sorting domain-containing protein [Gemmatimonadaceae bacterium]|nr:PEP-CTERM sorting domain-containing protein [Gemmatimonadaceae bacterium]